MFGKLPCTYYILLIDNLFTLYHNDLTWLDLSPAVGALSSGSDSGIGSLGFKSNEPDHPIHVPLHSTTTGATAVTRPPALWIEQKNHIDS